MRATVLASSLVLYLVLTGCSLAPKAIKRNYTTYNHTINYNQSQQMLLNLVRMRYRESPLFMKVGAVSTSYSFDVNAGGSVGSSFGEDNWGLNAGGGYSERPTVTYTPIEGDTFVKQILAEVNLSSFVLLHRSGWPITTLSHVLVEKFGRRVNNPDSPAYDDFVELVDQLQRAQDRGALEIVAEDEDMFLQLRDDEMGMNVAAKMIPLEDVQMRSFVDAMVFVNYNGAFYSIGRTDIKSKDTFALLKLIFQMQAGDIKSVQPILTLPVATP